MKPRRAAAWGLLLALGVAGMAQAQSPFPDASIAQPLPIGALGVVQLPALLPELEGVVKHPAPVKVFKEPGKRAPVLMVALAPRDLLTRETSYGGEEAVVFEVRNGWYQVQTRVGPGWVGGEQAGRYRPLEKLLLGPGHYLSAEWDGLLRESPSSAGKMVPIPWLNGADRFFTEQERPMVRVLSFRKCEGRLWVQVDLSREVFCSSATCLARPVRGWVPAYGSKGLLMIWFYAEGC